MAVNVEFGATTDKLEAGVERAKDAIQGFVAPVNDLSSAFDDLSKSSGAAGDALALLGGGVLIGAITSVLGLIKSSNQEMLELQKNAKEVGLSLDKFQELKYVANVGGVGDSQFLSSLQSVAGKFNDLLHDTGELSRFLDANNVKYQQANGHLIAFDQYLQEAARLVANAATEGDKFKAAELLGFSRDWVAVLERGPAALRAAMQEAQNVGVVLDDQLVKRDAEFAQRWNDTVAKWSAFFKAKIVELSDALGVMLHQSDALDAKWSEARATAADKIELERERAAGMDKAALEPGLEGALSNSQFAGGLAGFGLGGPVGALLGFGAGTALDSGAKLVNATERVQGAFAALTSTIDKATESANKATASSNTPGGPKTVFPGTPDSSAARAALTDLQGQIQAADLAYQHEAELLSNSLALHRMTEEQKTAATIAAINQRENVQLAAIADAEKVEGLTPAQQQRIENQKTAVILKAINDRAKAQEQAIAREQQQWENLLKPVQAAWDSQLRGLLAGTTTWATAMKNIFADLILDIIKALESAAITKAAVALTNAVGGGPAALAAHVAAITGDTGQTFAGFAAFLAPEMGPAAIPTALGLATSVQNTAIGLSSLDVGGYVLNSGLAMIHEGETVVPAQVSTPYQGGDGEGDVHVHLNGPVIGTQAFVNQLIPQLAKALSGYRTLNPSTV